MSCVPDQWQRSLSNCSWKRATKTSVYVVMKMFLNVNSYWRLWQIDFSLLLCSCMMSNHILLLVLGDVLPKVPDQWHLTLSVKLTEISGIQEDKPER